MPPRAPVIAISHGGGPMPVLGDPGHDQLVESLRNKVPKILHLDTPEAPRAIVLVTAHWQEDRPTISNAEKHSLFYDYYGFPPESYTLKYDAPGSPEVAKEVYRTLGRAGLKPLNDSERGWDHGVFVPMLLIHPSATVPIIQLSILSSQDATEHYKLGQALSSLRDQNIAIVGSGFATFHNLRILMSFMYGGGADPEFLRRQQAWSDSVTDAVTTEDDEERGKALKGWRDFPGSYQAHPRGGADHFMPLIVCAGAGGKGKAKHYVDDFKGLGIVSYYWE